MSATVRAVRRLVVTAVGSTVLAAGLLMLVLPGPGLLGTAAGLAILATEYHWARRYVIRVRRRAHDVSELASASPRNTAVAIAFGLSLLVFGVVVLVQPQLVPVAPTAVAISVMVGGVAVLLGTVVGYRERRSALAAPEPASDRVAAASGDGEN